MKKDAFFRASLNKLIKNSTYLLRRHAINILMITVTELSHKAKNPGIPGLTNNCTYTGTGILLIFLAHYLFF